MEAVVFSLKNIVNSSTFKVMETITKKQYVFMYLQYSVIAIDERLK